MEKANEVKKYLKKIMIVILSMVTATAFSINMDIDAEITEIIKGNSIFIMSIFIIAYLALNKTSEIKNKRGKIICVILAIIFSSSEIIGNTINTYYDLSGIITNGLTILKSIIRWIGSIVLFYELLINIFLKFDNSKIISKKPKWFKDNKRSFIITFLIIFLAWLPYFLNYYPGELSPDSMVQIYQSIFGTQLTNHHPVLHTLLIAIPLNIGQALGSYTVGVALFSILQMLTLALIFSFAIYYMAKKNVDIRIRIGTLIFYAFYPVNGLYSITMWKDIPFAMIMTLFTITMTEIATNKEQFFKFKRNIILLIINMILVMLLRNNGLYVIILTIPFMFLFARKYYKKLIVVTLIVLASYGIWKGPVFSLLNVKEGSSREALSIPLQQFARIMKYNPDSLSEQEKKDIYKYLPVDNLAEEYIPYISDPVKIHFDDEAFKQDKSTLVKLYFTLAIEHPALTLEAFLCNSYGYWYPEVKYAVATRNSTTEARDFEIYQEPIIHLLILEQFDSIIDNSEIPVISMLFSIGFICWIALIMLAYAIYRKNYDYILIYIPLIILWLTTLASPVFAEYRYVYAIFTCLPILIGINFKNNKI